MATGKEGIQDKRSFPRYTAQESSAVILTPGNIVSYRLLDISKAGLAFCYNGKADGEKILHHALITLIAEEIGSAEIPVQVVSDIEFDEKSLSLASVAEQGRMPYLRRCGVRFSSLSVGQQAAIDTYIENLQKTVMH